MLATDEGEYPLMDVRVIELETTTASREPSPRLAESMAELTQKERLQPSLLDRLTDDEPRRSVRSRATSASSRRRGCASACGAI